MTKLKNQRYTGLTGTVIGHADIVHIGKLDHEVIENFGCRELPRGKGVMQTSRGMEESGIDNDARRNLGADLVADLEPQNFLIERRRNFIVLRHRKNMAKPETTGNKPGAGQHFGYERLTDG